MLTPDVCRVLVGNLRMMLDEIEELVALPTQEQAGVVQNQLEFVSTKLELAVSMAAHGAGVVAAEPESPPVPAMPSLADLHRELMDELRDAGTVPKVPTRVRRKAPPRRKAA
jgi:hypothetical protein